MASAYEIYKEGGLLNSRYQKLQDISEGAYGIVSLAKDIQRSKLVAVKYVFKVDDDKPSKYQTQQHKFSKSIKHMDDDICEEALHEIEIHERLGHHLNIVSFLDCFDSFIILEYCPRGDLYEAIKEGLGPSSTKDIINVILQLISAVEFAHSKSIYHRDIKPENILIADDWTIRLSDWGLASTSRYCNDFCVGSERYMAPELFDEKNVQIYDAAKIDIWSIGICLLNLVFRKSPFSVANETDKSFSYFACNREALFDIFSSMSTDLFTVLRYCLTLDPDNRDLKLMKEELLKVQSLTIDDDLELIEKENSEKKSQYLEVKPITISGTANGSSQTRSFAIPTPNTRITNHFQEFKKSQFNRKDFFTPPSVSAHYMENFEKSRKGVYQPPHQRPTTPKTGSTTSNWIPYYATTHKKARKRGGSFNSFSSNSGKYVPPNLRSPAFGKSPLHTSVTTEAIEFEDDDALFVLEEADSSVATSHTPDAPDRRDIDGGTETDDLDDLRTGFSSVNLEDNYLSDVSSAPSLMAPSSQVEKSISSTLHDRAPLSRNGNDSSLSSSPDAESLTKKVYLHPYHRSKFQSQSKKPWAYHSSANHHQIHHNNHHPTGITTNHFNYHTRRHSASSSLKREIVSSSVPVDKTGWFQPSRIELDDEDEDEDDFETSDSYRRFASRVGEMSDNRDRKNQITDENLNKAGQIRQSVRELNPSAVIEL